MANMREFIARLGPHTHTHTRARTRPRHYSVLSTEITARVPFHGRHPLCSSFPDEIRREKKGIVKGGGGG